MIRLVALGLSYGAALLFLTWPLGRHLASRLPHTAIGCDFDSLASTWILAHVTRWLAAPTVPLGDANIYYPTRDALFYGPTCLASLPIFAPVFLATGNPTLAINAVLLVGLAATATTLHYVVWRWTGSHGAGLVAATAFLTTRWVLWDWIPAAPWFATLWCFPLIIYLVADGPRTMRGHAALVALVTLQCATDPVYVAPAVLAPLAAIALVRLLRPETRGGGGRLLGSIVVSVLLFVAAHAGQIALARREDLSRQTMWWFPVAPADLPADLLRPLSPMAIPLAAWLLASIAAVWAVGRPANQSPRRLAARHALWWTAAGLLLSLTPVMTVFGHAMHVTPLEWLEHFVPIHSRLRNPMRLRVAGLFGATLLAGLGFDLCLRRARRLVAGVPKVGRLVPLALPLAAVAAMYTEYRTGLLSLRAPLPAAYPTAAEPRTSPSLLALLRQPGGPLLELPLEGPVPIYPSSHARAMYRSIAHGRRLVNGYTSYYPAGFLDRMTVASRLPDADALAILSAETQLELVLVHAAELPRGTRERWLSIADGAQASRLRLWARDGDDLLFRVAPSADPDRRT